LAICQPRPLEKQFYFIIIFFSLTPVLSSQGMKKLRYAIQKKVQKSSWNEPYSSSSFTLLLLLLFFTAVGD